ncbi:MAG TPA: GntR family transcriptional regulator, partial [Nevskia sp.]|nr:GntR family transcriptional regulator [Nevskia sp.]
MEPLFEVGLELSAKGSRESSRSLYRQLRDAILDGRLAAGTRLPPTRKSAAYFGVSRNTAVEVYEKLLNEGCIVARHGSGTYVAAQTAVPSPAAPRNGAAAAYRLNGFWLRPEVTAAMNFWQDQPAPARSRAAPIDFRPALVDSRLFPFEVYRRVSAQQLRGLERKPASYKSPQGNQGNYHLRQAITG